MRDKSPIGRKGSIALRSQAREWVELYKLARESPDGLYCLNPADTDENRTYIDSRDTNFWVGFLEVFAEHGVFESGDDWVKVRNAELVHKQNSLRLEGMKAGKIEAKLGQDRRVTPRTIQRRIEKGRGSVRKPLPSASKTEFSIKSSVYRAGKPSQN